MPACLSSGYRIPDIDDHEFPSFFVDFVEGAEESGKGVIEEGHFSP